MEGRRDSYVKCCVGFIQLYMGDIELEIVGRIKLHVEGVVPKRGGFVEIMF